MTNQFQLPELNSDGKLPAFAWPGGYPLFYLSRDNSILCPDCATAALDDEIESFQPTACDVHWEGDPLVCDECNTEIESAYGPVE